MALNKLHKKDFSIAVKTGGNALDEQKFAKQASKGELFFNSNDNKLYIATTDAGLTDATLKQVQLSDYAAPFGNTYSVDFDGSNDYMSIPGLTSCYAFSCWIKPDSTITSYSGIKGNLLGQGTTNWFGGLGGDLTGDFTNELITIRPGFGYTSTTDLIPSSSWTHIAIRWEAINSQTNPGGAGYDIFKNGTKVGNVATSSPPTSPLTFSTGILGARRTSDNFFNGKIDEVGFWSSTVTEADIATMYNSGVPGDLEDCSVSPYGWWRMGDNDGGSGTTITDQGSGGNNGTLTNGPTFSIDIPS